MAQRGRKSAASLSVVQEAPIGVQRLKPSKSLSQAESNIWIEAVNDQPADAFTDTHIPMLEIYCRHIARGEVLAEQINNFNPNGLKDNEGLLRYDRLLKMAEREGRAASSTATRLRLTRQSIDQQTVARSQINAPSSKGKSWEFEG